MVVDRSKRPLPKNVMQPHKYLTSFTGWLSVHICISSDFTITKLAIVEWVWLSRLEGIVRNLGTRMP